MNEDKPTIDLDEEKILAKFNNLLNKYQDQGKMISGLHPVAQEIESDKIPTLTEVVILHPAPVQPQPKRLTTIRQILDAALEDAHIEMDVSDRKALARALETRLAARHNRT